MSAPGDDSSVKVAIRIRPQLAREHLEGARVRFLIKHILISNSIFLEKNCIFYHFYREKIVIFITF